MLNLCVWVWVLEQLEVTGSRPVSREVHGSAPHYPWRLVWVLNRVPTCFRDFAALLNISASSVP